MKLFDLQGKTALITGSGRGIGLTLARGLAGAGAMIVLNDVDGDRLETAVASLKAENIETFGALFNVSNESEVGSSLARIEKEFAPVDILVNNAGIQIRAPLEEFAVSDWQRLIDINLTGAFVTGKMAARGMIARRSGKIINICSIQSELARPTIAPYTAAKGGLRNLTRGMATDWGKYNIQVNGIAPGYFKTEMTRTLYENPDFDAWLCSRVPMNRWGDPAELVGAAVFLAARASDYVNGQMLFVDGGLTACV